MIAETAVAVDVGIILVVAAVFGILAHQTGQPSIIAYIIAGLLIGPAFLGIVEVTELTETMAELGLAFLLFLLGIKMRFEDVKHILRPVVLISLPQMGLVFAAGFVVSIGLGFSTTESVLIGLAVMYSSTAVVIKMLTNKDEATSLHGKIDVGILLVQDIVVVILLAVLAAGQFDSPTSVAVTLATVLLLIAVLGVVAIAMSRYVLPTLFHRIAGNANVFFIIAVSWAFLFVLVSEELNLSIEMGAFLAGISIAQLPYSKELKGRINPLTDLFILVFFASIGLQLEAEDLFAHWEAAIIAALVLMPVKFLIFYGLLHWQGFDLETTFLGSANMVQVSEFGLIVGTVAVGAGLIGDPILGFLSLVALITMGISVYLIQYNRWILARIAAFLDIEPESRPAEGRRDHAIIVGYDEIGHEALRVLDAHYEVVVVDRNPRTIRALREDGYDTVFGDFRHVEIRKDAGLKRAAVVLSCSVQWDVNRAILNEIAPDTTAFIEAEWESQAREYYRLGADYVVLSSQLAGDRLVDHIQRYLKDPQVFSEYIDEDITKLRRQHSFLHGERYGGTE